MRKFNLLLVSVLLLCAVSTASANEIWDAGVAAFTSKNYSGAEAQFKKLVEQNPDGASSHYMLGLTLEQLGRKEEALHHLRKAYDLNPNDLATKVALGRAYFKVRRYDDVTKLLGTVDASTLPGAQQAAFYQIRGQAKFKSGNEAGAVSDFKQLARLMPSDAKAQYTYGTTALKAGQLDESLRALGKAVQLDPGNADMKRALAQVYVKKGRETRGDKTAKKSAYLKASQLASELVAKDPSYENQMLKISAELGAGDYTKAIATGKAAAASPKATWLASYYLGQAYTSAGQFAAAEAPLNAAKAKASKPDDKKKIWRQLGFSYEKQKKYSQSIEAYQFAGDQGGVARVQENEKTERENKRIDEENKTIKAMEEEARKLEAELKAMEGGGL